MCVCVIPHSNTPTRRVNGCQGLSRALACLPKNLRSSNQDDSDEELLMDEGGVWGRPAPPLFPTAGGDAEEA